MDDAYKRAYDQAIRLLARRDYGEWELQRKLLQGKTSREVVQQVCEQCQALGYLDDATFAHNRVRSRFLNSNYGPEKVRAELRSLQIEEQTIQQALDIVLQEHDVVHLAASALQKRFGPSVQGPFTDEQATDEWSEDDREERSSKPAAERDEPRMTPHGKPGKQAKEKKRRYDFLMRRGFNAQTIWQVLE